MVMAFNLKLSLEDLNKIKLSSLIKMAKEIEYLNNSEEKKVYGNPNDFKF